MDYIKGLPTAPHRCRSAPHQLPLATAVCIIHLPRSKEGQEELAKRVATVHAQLIYNYISRLECSTEQKVALLDAIQENIHDEIKKEKEG